MTAGYDHRIFSSKNMKTTRDHLRGEGSNAELNASFRHFWKYVIGTSTVMSLLLFTNAAVLQTTLLNMIGLVAFTFAICSLAFVLVALAETSYQMILAEVKERIGYGR